MNNINALYLVLLYIVILNAGPVPTKLGKDTRLSKFNTTLINQKLLNFLTVCNNEIIEYTDTVLCDVYYDMLISLNSTNIIVTESTVNNTLMEKNDESKFCDELIKIIPKVSKNSETNKSVSILYNHTKTGNCDGLCKTLASDGNFKVKPICRLVLWGYTMEQNLTSINKNEEKPAIIPKPIDTDKKEIPDKIEKPVESLKPIEIVNTPNVPLEPVKNPNNVTSGKENNNADVSADKLKVTPSGVSNEDKLPIVVLKEKTETPSVVKVAPQVSIASTLNTTIATTQSSVVNQEDSLAINVPPSSPLANIKPKPEENNSLEGNDIVNPPADDIFDMEKPNDTTNLDDDNNLMGDFNPNKNEDQLEDQEDNGDFDSIEDDTQPDALKETNNKELIHQDSFTKTMDVKLEDPFFEESDSNFFSYFMFIMVGCIISYVIYHNKTKMLALMLEGRRGVANRAANGGSRRKHTAAYRKLDSNLEEAITSSGTNNRSAQIIY